MPKLLQTCDVSRSLSLALFLALTATANLRAAIIWEAFNDYRPTDGVTSPNATTYDLRIQDDGGVLRNIATGADLEASVHVTVEGNATPDDFGALTGPNTNSPAAKLFQGKVDLWNAGLPGIRNSAETKLILDFTGLDPTKRYNFRGAISRGGNYDVRWTIFTIVSADAYVHAHEDGSVNKNIFTKATFPASNIETNQVVLNSGENKVGSLVGWDNIEPGADGTFSIVAQQYVGVAPFGNPSAGPYGYGFNGIYLAKVDATGNLRITENPASQKVPAGTTASLKVVAASPQAIQYQWQKAAPGTTNFANITGATQSTYTTPTLTVADDGARFRCNLTSGGVTATSGEATISVDGTIPTITSVVGSVNFNAIHITFSEAIKIEMLGNLSNYTVSGGLSISNAVVLDSGTVRLLTSTQALNTAYSVSLKNLEDIAGNKIPANSSVNFTSFSVVTNAVGLEIWNTLLGGTVADLRNSARYPSQPDVDYSTTNINSLLVVPDGPNNTYAGRFRAWLTPEETADYEFFIRADDQGEFRISLDDKFDTLDDVNIAADAVDTSAGDPFQEPGIDLSVSVPIHLEKGKRYAVQAIWKEGNGNDYCQVAWRKVGDATPADQLQPISGKFLSYYGPGAASVAPPKITKFSFLAGKVILEWTGTLLQSSDDLVTWKDETGATSPLSISPGAKKFYRVKN